MTGCVVPFTVASRCARAICTAAAVRRSSVNSSRAVSGARVSRAASLPAAGGPPTSTAMSDSAPISAVAIPCCTGVSCSVPAACTDFQRARSIATRVMPAARRNSAAKVSGAPASVPSADSKTTGVPGSPDASIVALRGPARWPGAPTVPASNPLIAIASSRPVAVASSFSAPVQPGATVPRLDSVTSVVASSMAWSSVPCPLTCSALPSSDKRDTVRRSPSRSSVRPSVAAGPIRAA